jgi:CubicO group peptidase (beta-lactamase class C family)
MRFDRSILLFALALSVPAASHSQQPAVAAATTAAARVDAVFARYTKATPGCAVGVARDGQEIFARAYGMADLERDVAATPATIYEAGSVSKQFTAAAIVLLAQQGRLSLDDDVRKHIPEVPDYGTPITLRHLLTHTSGLRDWGSVASIEGWPRGERAHTHAHVLEIVGRQSALNYPPGAAYSYTNTGYNLLVMIVDRVSGMSFADFSEKNLFEPLGMRNTEWRDDHTRIVKNRAIAYSPRRGGGFSIDMPFENVHGNGGLLTTVGDLLTWTRNLETGKVGGPKFIQEMHRQGILTSGRQITYASGLMVNRYNDVPEVSHTGSTAGYRAFLARYPDQKLAVALLCNVGSASPGGLGHDVADAFLGDAVRRAAASAPRGITLPAAQLEAKAGLYRDPATGESLRLGFADGALRIDRGAALVALSPTLFQVGTGSRRLAFESVPGNPRQRIRETSEPDEAVVYEPVAEFTPTAADLNAYVGEYHSSDAGVSLTAAVEGGRLIVRRRPDTRFELTPVYADAFDGGPGRIRFIRDSVGRVTELSIRQSRVWDIRFVKR